MVATHYGEISSDQTHRMIEGIDAHFVPGHGSWFESALNTSRQTQIFLDFHLPLAEFGICTAEFLLSLDLLRDIREAHNPELASAVSEYPRTDNDRQPGAVLSRQHKGVSISFRPEV